MVPLLHISQQRINQSSSPIHGPILLITTASSYTICKPNQPFPSQHQHAQCPSYHTHNTKKNSHVVKQKITQSTTEPNQWYPCHTPLYLHQMNPPPSHSHFSISLRRQDHLMDSICRSHPHYHPCHYTSVPSFPAEKYHKREQTNIQTQTPNWLRLCPLPIINIGVQPSTSNETNS